MWLGQLISEVDATGDSLLDRFADKAFLAILSIEPLAVLQGVFQDLVQAGTLSELSSGSLSPGLSDCQCPPLDLAETGEDHVTPSSNKGLIMRSAEPGKDSTVEVSTALEKSVDTPATDSQQSVVGRSAAHEQCEMTATTYCAMESSNPAKPESEEGQCACF